MGIEIVVKAFIVEEMRFLNYIVFHQDIQIEEEQITAVCDWPEPQLVRDI